MLAEMSYPAGLLSLTGKEDPDPDCHVKRPDRSLALRSNHPVQFMLGSDKSFSSPAKAKKMTTNLGRRHVQALKASMSLMLRMKRQVMRGNQLEG